MQILSAAFHDAFASFSYLIQYHSNKRNMLFHLHPFVFTISADFPSFVMEVLAVRLVCSGLSWRSAVFSGVSAVVFSAVKLLLLMLLTPLDSHFTSFSSLFFLAGSTVTFRTFLNCCFPTIVTMLSLPSYDGDRLSAWFRR